MDDALIVSLFYQRSDEALIECSIKFGQRCRIIAENILNSFEDAEECLNETWLKAWNAIPPAKPLKLGAYLARITRNIALDRYDASHAQKRGGAVETALSELSGLAMPEKASEGEITGLINAFLLSEKPKDADIFVKRYWYLLSNKEIAKETGYSESKIASILHRMRSRLKSQLENNGLM